MAEQKRYWVKVALIDRECIVRNITAFLLTPGAPRGYSAQYEVRECGSIEKVCIEIEEGSPLEEKP